MKKALAYGPLFSKWGVEKLPGPHPEKAYPRNGYFYRVWEYFSVLFYGYRLCQVSGLVNIAFVFYSYIISQKLQG